METLVISSHKKSALASLVGFAALVTVVVVGASWSAASANTSQLGPSNAWRQHQALVAAEKLLASAPLPAGAQEIATYDPAYRASLGQAGEVNGDPDQVVRTKFYQVANGVKAQAAIHALVFEGHGATMTGTGSEPNQPPTSSVGFSPTGTALLPSPELLYTMIITKNGDLEFRVDASETWTPRKSVYSLVGAGATKLIVTANPRNGTGIVPPSYSSTTTNLSIINHIRLQVNDLPAAYPGVMSCPADAGATLDLSFFHAGAATPYATVRTRAGGCGGSTITQFNAAGSTIGTTSVGGGSLFTSFVTKAMGMKALDDSLSHRG